MKLDFYESDVLAWFLRERKSEFLQCAGDFGYDEDEAESLRLKICGKVLVEFHRECVRGAKQRAKSEKQRKGVAA